MRVTGALGLAVLAAVWVWPLPALGLPPFTSHMLGHMAVVVLAAPLLAASLAGGPRDPTTGRFAAWFLPIPASMLEGIAVWSWHVPALHHAARHHPWAWTLEQATFLAGGLLLWTAALGGGPVLRRERAVGGVVALLLTSMHMTLLGVLIALTPRLLYGHDTALDQHLGGVVMILLGGVGYGAGGLWLARDLLRGRPA